MHTIKSVLLLVVFLTSNVFTFAQNDVKVNIENRLPGGLNATLSELEYDLTKIEELTIRGFINAEDYILILFKMKELRRVDLSGTTIVACKFENPYITFLTPMYYRGRANTLTFGFRIMESIGVPEEPSSRKLEEVVLPKNLEVIDDGFFDGKMDDYRLLKGEVNLPGKLRYIGLGVFSGSEISYALPLPESLKFLGSGRVSVQGELLLPRKLAYFNRAGFESPGVTSYALSKGRSGFTVIDGVLFTKDGKKLIAFPEGRTGSYKIPQSVKEIAPGAFFNCQGLKEIILNQDLDVIADSAFYLCESLEKIVMNNSLRIIGNEAFGICRKLKNIELPESLDQIGDGAFMGCDRFSRLTIPSSIKEEKIGYLVFEGNTPMVIELKSKTPYKDGVRIFGNSKARDKARIKVPKELKNIYQISEGWDGFTFMD